MLFRKKNGTIYNLDTGEETQFKRLGNIYVMDAYLPNPDCEHAEDMEVDGEANNEESTGFTRQGAR